MSSLLLTTLDTGNTAWMIMATILVLLMSIPGIALFNGGLVRQKNILSILMQTVFIVAVVSLIWVAFGYSWAFSTEYADSGNPLACVIGGFDKCFLHGIGLEASVIPGHSLQNMPIRAILWLASSVVSINVSSTASAWMPSCLQAFRSSPLQCSSASSPSLLQP